MAVIQLLLKMSIQSMAFFWLTSTAIRSLTTLRESELQVFSPSKLLIMVQLAATTTCLMAVRVTQATTFPLMPRQIPQAGKQHNFRWTTGPTEFLPMVGMLPSLTSQLMATQAWFALALMGLQMPRSVVYFPTLLESDLGRLTGLMRR